MFYFFSNSFIFEEATRAWEVKATKYEDLEKYDAGIVLGGMLSYDVDYDRIQFHRGTDRFLQAIELYKTGTISKIMFVGGSGSIEFSHIREGVFVRRYLLTLGIPESDFWIESESRNTRENALNAGGLVVEKNYLSGKFLLITSAHHMRRAQACFNKVGLNTTSYSVDRHASDARRYTFDHLFIPDASCFSWWNALIREWVGIVVYKIKGFA